MIHVHAITQSPVYRRDHGITPALLELCDQIERTCRVLPIDLAMKHTDSLQMDKGQQDQRSHHGQQAIGECEVEGDGAPERAKGMPQTLEHYNAVVGATPVAEKIYPDPR